MKTYIYVADSKSFIDDGNKHVKIGSSNNPVNRRESLQTSLPRELILLRVYEIINYTAYAIDDFLKTINTFPQLCDGIDIKNYHPDPKGGTEHYIMPNIDDLNKLFDVLEVEYEVITDLSIFDTKKNHIERDTKDVNIQVVKELTGRLKKKCKLRQQPIISKADKCSGIWKLQQHQQEVIDIFKKDYLEGTRRTGIVCHPTGSGKTISAIAMIGLYWEYYKQKSVLWITEKKDVLRSQFDDEYKMNKCAEAGFIQNTTFYNKHTLYDYGSTISKINNDSQKPLLIIANIDSIMTNEKYKLFDKSKIGLVILDECHSSGALDTYNMLRYFLDNWTDSLLIGFSATPLRTEDEKFKKTSILFGDGVKINFISMLSIIDAIDRNLIVPPEFVWVETDVNKDVSYRSFMRQLEDNEYLKIIKHVDNVLKKSVTMKVIMWTQTTKNADEWLKIFLECQKGNKYINLKQFKIFITHTNLGKYKDELKEFMDYDDPCAIICVGRCREGFDDARIDVCINLDAVQTRGSIVFTQETGRALRVYNDKKHGIMMDTFTFSDEKSKREQICELLVGYIIFLKQSALNSKTIDINKEYAGFVNNLEVDTKKKISVYKTPDGNLIKFKIISSSLKMSEWKDMKQIMMQKFESVLYRDGISYESAKKIIQQYKKILTKKSYRKLCETEKRLPCDPIETFGDKFIDWIDYLGIEQKYYDINTCKKEVLQYLIANNIRGIISNYSILCKILRKKNKMFPPVGMWVEYYKSDTIRTISDIICVPKEKKSLDLLLK